MPKFRWYPSDESARVARTCGCRSVRPDTHSAPSPCQRDHGRRPAVRRPVPRLGCVQRLRPDERLLPGLPDRDHRRLHVRADRARLHARLRHPRADQLRARRRVHARRHVHDHLRDALLQPAPGAGLGDRADRLRDAAAVDARVWCDQRDDRVHRLPAAAERAATCAADHRDRRELHHRGRRPRMEGPELHLVAGRLSALRGVHRRRCLLRVEQADRRRHHRAGADRADVSHPEDPPGQGDARRCAGSGRERDDGDQRQPDDLVHVPDRRRARRRGRPAVCAVRDDGALRPGLPARADRVHRRGARRHRQPAGGRPRRHPDRPDPGVQRGPAVALAGLRLDRGDRVLDPDPDPRVPARGPARRTDAGGRMTELTTHLGTQGESPTEQIGYRNKTRAWWRGLTFEQRLVSSLGGALVLTILLWLLDHALGYASLIITTIYWLRRTPARYKLPAEIAFVVLLAILAITWTTPWSLVLLIAVGGAITWIPDGRKEWGVPAALLALAVLYPFYADQMFTMPIFGVWPDVGTGVYMLVFVMMAVGLNIVVGYAGLLDLGYVAFYAFGAYTAAWLMSLQFPHAHFSLGAVGLLAGWVGVHITMWLVLVLAGCITPRSGIVIGLPTLRLRGDYLASVTLGFGEILPK